jgi:hypothetical protein
MQNNTLMLNNIILEEIIKAKLILPTNESLITETIFTTGTYDLATISKNIGWTESMGTPWSNQQAVKILRNLGAVPFACSAGGNNRYLSAGDQKAIETKMFGGETDIGYQVLLYTKEIGTLLRFYKDFTMHSTGNAETTNTQWGWSIKNGKIHLQYETKAYANQLMHDEGYLQKRGGEVVFADTAKPALMTNKEKQAAELAATLKYAAKYKYIYGSSVKAPHGYWTRALDRLQTVFDWTGIFYPPIDIINCLIYINRDRYLEAFFSVIALIPVVGDVFNLIAKYTIKGVGGILKFTGRVAVRGYTSIFRAIFKRLPRWAPETLEAAIRQKHATITAGLQKLASHGVITPKQMREYMALVDAQLEAMGKAITKLEQEAAEKVAREKLASNPYVSKLLFGKHTPLVNAAEPFLQRFLGKKGGKFAKVLTYHLVKLFTHSNTSIIALYKKLLYKIMIEMSTNPKILAMLAASFEDKTIIKAIMESKLGHSELKAMAAQFPYLFKMVKGRITGIEVRYLGTILEKLYAGAAGSTKLYKEIAVSVFEKLSRGSTNFFWDLYRTNPFRNIMARATNPVQRLAAAFPGSVGEILPKAANWLKGDFFGKQLDIIYNEVVKYREITAGQPDLSKNSIMVAAAYEIGVFDKMEYAQKKLEYNKDFKFIRSISSDEAGYKPFRNPGATDSLTFKNWSADLDPKIKAQYVKALQSTDDASRGLYAKQAYKDVVSAVAGLGTDVRGVQKAIESLSNQDDFRIFLGQFKDGKTGYSSFNDMINGEYGVANYWNVLTLVTILRNKLPGWTIKYNKVAGGLLGNTFKGGFAIYKK